MKKIVRLTESDLVRIVKRVINEQNESKEQLEAKIKKTFGISSFCNVRNKTYPYNEDVKKLQEILKQQRYNASPEGKIGVYLKPDGILGPKTLGVLCPA